MTIQSRTVAAAVAAIIAAAPALAQETLQIGVSDALTGGAAVYGLPQAHAVEMAAEEINSAGGVQVGGETYMLEVVAYDDKGNPTEATNAVRKLIDFDGIKYILGFCCSGATGAVASSLNTRTR